MGSDTALTLWTFLFFHLILGLSHHSLEATDSETGDDLVPTDPTQVARELGSLGFHSDDSSLL